MKKAFTLIELLVVVSIIALLIAILLPVLANSKYAVRTTICQSNLKQIGIGVTAYTSDNDGFYPHKMLPGATNFVSPIDGRLYRLDAKPWSIRSKDKWDYIDMVADYFNDLNETFLCPHVASDWDTDVYSKSTNATIIPYGFYWGMTNGPGGVQASRVPMTKIGEGMGPGTRIDGGGVTQDSRYFVMASDQIRRGNSFGIPDGAGPTNFQGNHPPTGGDYYFNASPNGDGTGYRYDRGGNANFLYEDGSVELYADITTDDVGNGADQLFRNASRWIIPTDRVR
ncbi:MAG: prepilin-type N-terminal cleavage/methylation domain-containing protein [Planctomycetota bacterium]